MEAEMSMKVMEIAFYLLIVGVVLFSIKKALFSKVGIFILGFIAGGIITKKFGNRSFLHNQMENRGTRSRKDSGISAKNIGSKIDEYYNKR